MDTRFDLSAVIVLERLVELLQWQSKELRELVEEVRGLREAIERLMSRRLRVERVGDEHLFAHQLSEDEVRLVEMFMDWMRGNWYKWVEMYEGGQLEGVDKDRGVVYLRRGTLLEFLERVSGLGYVRGEVLRLLGDLGVLRFKVKESGRRQYCIPVRMRVVGEGPDGRVVERTTVGSRYVVEVNRLSEVSRELREMRRVKYGEEGVDGGVGQLKGEGEGE
jgi:hypothetical protein